MVTGTQVRYLRCIRDFTETNGYPPTWRELNEMTGHSSTNAAHEMIARLRDKGLVTWTEDRARTLQLTEEGKRYATD